MAAAELAASPMPNVARTRILNGTAPGVARNMPTTAVNTINATTRGLASSKYSRARIKPFLTLDVVPTAVVVVLIAAFIFINLTFAFLCYTLRGGRTT